MLTLHDLYPHDFYPKKIQEWLEAYSGNCRVMDSYEADDMYDYKMKELTDGCGVDSADCVKIVRKHLNKYNHQNTIVLSENVKLALVQLAYDYGFGKKRLDRLVDSLLTTDRPNALEEIKKFGVDYEPDIGGVDWRKLTPKKKKEKVSLAEEKRLKQEMAWLKNYQEHINGDTTNGN